MLARQIQYVACKCKATILPDDEKPFYAVLVKLSEVPIRHYEPYA